MGKIQPPPNRRPYREALPPTSVRKGEPVTYGRPKLNYRANPEPVAPPFDHIPATRFPVTHIVQSENFPTLPEGLEYYHGPGSHTQPQIFTTNQWNVAAPVLYPGQEQYDTTYSYPHYILPGAIPHVYMSQPFPANSPQQVFHATQPVQINPQLAVNSFSFQESLSPPAFQDNFLSIKTHVSSAPQQNSLGYHPQPSVLLDPVVNGNSQYVHAQQVQVVPAAPPHSHSHTQPQVIGQNWAAQRPYQHLAADAPNHQHPKYSQAHSEHQAEEVISLAHKFVEEFCPHVNSIGYCHPPVIRPRHPDKASKQLVQGQESEQRVIGTFERFFASTHKPVVMLCHYPLTGFLLEHVNKQCGPGKAVVNPSVTRESVTLILVSQEFPVTTVTVSIIGSNSDYNYILRGVAKAAGHSAKCGKAVAKWLTSLGLAANVREVLAFPNLKHAIIQRLSKDKAFPKALFHVSLLHLDELCAPFEEEWSTPGHQRLFKDWVERHVVRRQPSLSANDVKLFVGALLSPQLSSVETMKNVQSLEPIPEKPLYSDKEPSGAEDIGQLQLTIDGVTMAFDAFMDTYVSFYYPEVETKTYRVPPLHFNIQAFKKGTEYLRSVGGSSALKDSEEEEESSPSEAESEQDFMSQGSSYSWQATPLSGQVVNSTAVSSGDESSDADERLNTDSSTPRSRLWAIERVTLDSIPDHTYYPSQAAESKKDSQWKSHARLRSRVKPVSGEPSFPHNLSPSQGPPVALPQSNGASVVLLTQNSKSRNTVREPTPKSATSIFGSSSPHPAVAAATYVHAAVNQPVVPQSTGYVAGPVVNSHAPLYSKAPSKVTPKTRVKSQAVILQDTWVMSDVMAKDARADEGENRVINAMELLGKKFGPMFIICSYQYNNYLNKLREEMFSKGEASRPTRAFGQIMRAEHDCLIFHKNYGVLVVCIKSIGDNFSDWNASQEQMVASTAKILHKALKQLEREEAMIRHVTSDLASVTKLACHRLIAMPNMRRAQVNVALNTDPDLAQKIHVLTKGRGTKSFLCLDELPDKNMSVWDPPEHSVLLRLVSWWQGLAQSLSAPENVIDTKVYRHIIGRYCGLLSTMEVWTPNNPRVEVRSMSEAVKLCAQRFSQVVLLPEQLQVLLSNHKRIYLYGPPGSGKTLLLTLKAREWLLRGHKVILINSRWGSTDGFPYAYGVLHRLKQMMTKDGVPFRQLVMINVDTSQFHPSMLSGVLPSCCVLADEVKPSTLPIIEHLCCLQVQSIWCAGLFLDDRPHTAHHFQAFKMEKVLRCPPIVQTLLKHTEADAKHGAPYTAIYEESFPLLPPGESHRTSRSLLPHPEMPLSKKQKEKNGDVEVLSEEIGDRRNSFASVKGQNSSVTENGVASAGGEEEGRKFDVESLNERLAKLGNTVQRTPTPPHEDIDLHNDKKLIEFFPNSFVYGLPTDGPRPYIIDHEGHREVGLPLNCASCGTKLANFLLSMVKSEPQPEAQGSPASVFTGGEAFTDTNAARNKSARESAGEKPKGKTRKAGGPGSSSSSNLAMTSTTASPTTTTAAAAAAEEQRLRKMFESRALSWSDVLIVTSSLPKSSALLNTLRKRGIPVEMVAAGRVTRTIETSRERQKLFVTTYTEVVGLERALIVFVPSTASKDPLGSSEQDDSLRGLKELSLRNCVRRYSEDDRRALWFMASRCLSDLVLLLP